ncbi:hypothetical protein BDP27DRAFT_1363446 [Rhodocollybia butyracea]|uniref:F-box domain-containing protein n=1 Tax=Rhodocollybia butyracea TaxID=206335 RepID=A0A9P5U7Z8_9AGAR|nr:hypothetical protein BDP27DRAFT_1363446 [Rhodocollybia butyracea]
MSMANFRRQSQLYSKHLDSANSQMCSSLEATYQALYTEFLAKSRHNDIPNSTADRVRLRALIDQTRSDLETCSESATRVQISKVLELQESLLAPIRTLPSDILTEIFQLVIETSSNPGITWKPTKISGRIFLLTWICFSWRDEALSYSAFWSTIAVVHDVPPGVPPSPTEMTALLNECIMRSGVSVPMRIRIFSYSSTDESLPAVIPMLVAQAHRWRQAALSFRYLHQIKSLFPFKPSSSHFPLLEDLSFQFRDYAHVDPGQNPILECHPPLQKLGLSLLLESYADVISSRSLKVLKLDRYRGVSLARLLRMCPRLESLTLRSFESTGNPKASKTIYRSSLLTLDIGGDYDNDNKVEYGAWNSVMLPKLIKLEVTLPDLIDHQDWEMAFEARTSLSKLREVIKQSKCALQHVNLIMYVADYKKWPQLTLGTANKFFEDLPVKAEGSFVENKLLAEWKEDLESTIRL